MKKSALIIITVCALITAVAFKAAMQAAYTTNARLLVADQKKFTIRCSPVYIPGTDDDIPPLTGWGNYEWKITTTSDSAQYYFNQGINMYYGFHIIESRASFDKAIRFDEACAMAWYGKALAYGPNINDFGYQRPSEAFSSAQKSNALKAAGSPIEQALIRAMAVRYSNDSLKDQNQLNIFYKDEMQAVYLKYNNDENVSALYADALMLLHPWDLYNHDYSPKEWTPPIVSVIKHTLKLNPQHPGANHYYIHAVEASANPADALSSAAFLSDAMPGVSHVTHMPSHIYIRTGYYDKGIVANENAVSAYHNYLNAFPSTVENVALYELHNIHMNMNCAQMAGHYAKAMATAIDLQRKIPQFYVQIPGPLGNYVQYLHQSPLFTYIRFGKWQQILKEPVNDSLSFTAILQHFARGMAYAKTNNLAAAQTALQQMKNKLEADGSLKEPLTPFNAAYDAGVIALNILAGTIAGQKQDFKTAINWFKKAVEAEDKLIYNEPRDWLLPARQYLGNAYLEAEKYTEALEVFKKDLTINPNNGWALTGLMNGYKGLKKSDLAATANKRLTKAWLIKDLPIEAPVF